MYCSDVYLHCYLMETFFYCRCLMSRDFVRLGKWFVQPYSSSEKLDDSR